MSIDFNEARLGEIAVFMYNSDYLQEYKRLQLQVQES
jgi:hypothetical protein